MTTHNDGGPAFPQVRAHDERHGETSGMSRLDYFAGRAMQGWLAGSDSPFPHTDYHVSIATNCFYLAEAMLAESERRAT